MLNSSSTYSQKLNTIENLMMVLFCDVNLITKCMNTNAKRKLSVAFVLSYRQKVTLAIEQDKIAEGVGACVNVLINDHGDYQ